LTKLLQKLSGLLFFGPPCMARYVPFGTRRSLVTWSYAETSWRSIIWAVGCLCFGLFTL